MTDCFLSAGSNINPESNMMQSVRLISEHFKISKISSVYLNQAFDRRGCPDFLNLMIKLDCEISARSLKKEVLEKIELNLGRIRTEDKYASRPLDLDIVLFGSEVVQEKDLVVPDPDLCKRDYIYVPLLEIEPELMDPVTGRFLKDEVPRKNEWRYESTMMIQRSFSELLKNSVFNKPQHQN